METFPPAWRPAGLQTPKQQSKYHASLVQWMASIIYDLIYPHQTWQYFPIASPNFLSLTVAQRRAEGEKEPKDRSGRSTWFNRQWGSNIYCTSPLVPLMVSTISYSTCLNLCFFFQPANRCWLTVGIRGRVRPLVIQGEIYDSAPKAKNEHRGKKIRHRVPALPVCGKQKIGDAQKAGKFVYFSKNSGMFFWTVGSTFLGEVPQTQRWRAKGRAEEKSSAKTP